MRGIQVILERNTPCCRLTDAVRSTRCFSSMKCRRGFTLIEVVAVLAILGIITAMALPKYFSIMNEGKYKVAQAAAAEGHARVNMWGMSQYLQSGAWPTVDQYESAADLIGRDTGEFVLHYMKENETTLKVSAKGQVATNFEGVEATLRITPPGNGGP